MNIPATAALMDACQREDRQAMMSAIRTGADPNATVDGCTALMTAAALEDETLVDALLAAGADVNARDAKAGCPLLYYLAAYARSDKEHRILRKLIQAGADVNAQAPGEDGERGPRPLEVAVQLGNLATASILEEHGALCAQATAVRLSRLRDKLPGRWQGR